MRHARVCRTGPVRIRHRRRTGRRWRRDRRASTRRAQAHPDPVHDAEIATTPRCPQAGPAPRHFLAALPPRRRNFHSVTVGQDWTCKPIAVSGPRTSGGCSVVELEGQRLLLTHALSFLAFIVGGVGYVVGMGLLVAGIAVPALILRFIPRWLAWTGLVIAALSELTFLSMAIEPLQFLLPVGRFGGLLWLIAVGFLLPQNRAAANREER